jgi:hypothetical protein
MRKPISIDRVKMKTLGYGKAPIRQILMLNLSSEEMIILLNFFSHKSNWEIGNTGISERNYFRTKNQKRVKKIVEKLKELGYVSESETAFTMNLDKIQEDANTNLTTLTLSKSIKFKEKRKKYTKTTLTQSKVLPLTQSKVLTLTQSKSNNNNNNAGDAAPKAAAATSNNKTNEDEKDFGDVTLSGVCAFSAPQTLHTPNVEEKNDTIPMVMSESNTPNDLQLIINTTNFGNIYESNTGRWGCWKNVNISSYSNYDIAYAIYMKEKNQPLKDIPSEEYNLVYNMLGFLVRYSKDAPDSNLWQEYQKLKKNNKQ